MIPTDTKAPRASAACSGGRGLAIDLGTSGFRAQLLEPAEGGTVAETVITRRHPVPGANVMDHLHFALEAGPEAARALMVAAVNRLIAATGCPAASITRVALCGNPIQLSLFLGIEIRDLAYAGRRKREKMGIRSPDRRARRMAAGDIPGLSLNPDTLLLVPPAVRHEIGADALALIIRADLVSRSGITLAIDFGTNAEMALSVNGAIYTGSAAAGPALEGQHIGHGMLAMPGAVSDVTDDVASGEGGERLWQTTVLDRRMAGAPGEILDVATGRVVRSMRKPRGVTGTGVVALLATALSRRLIRRPHIRTPDGSLYLSAGMGFDRADLAEAGKAIGAIRSGILTLCKTAGVAPAAIRTVCLAGAGGSGMDPVKAQIAGLLPGRVRRVFQLGNTSLWAARRLVADPGRLDAMQQMADRIGPHHVMFASSPDFSRAYMLELSFWQEGLPVGDYRRFLEKFRLPDWPARSGGDPAVVPAAPEMIDPGNRGLSAVDVAGPRLSASFAGCTGSGRCLRRCPERALALEKRDGWILTLDPGRCRGTGCRLCEAACEAGALKWDRFGRTIAAERIPSNP